MVKNKQNLLENKPAIDSEISELVHNAPALPTEAEEWIEAHRLHVYDNVEPTEYLCAADNVGFIPRYDLTFISGEAGQGKTLIEAVILSVMLSGNPWGRLSCPITDMEMNIGMIETEMTPGDAMDKIFHRIAQISGLSNDEIEKRMSLYQTPDLDEEELMEFTKTVIDTKNHNVYILDNIGDFTSDANEQKANKAFIHELNKLAKTKKITIICTSHTNPGDPRLKMDGSRGTHAKRKAGSVLYVKKNGDVFDVTATKSRNKPMPKWSVCYDENNNVVPADKWAKKTQEVLEAQKAAKKHKILLDTVGKEYTLTNDYLLSHGCSATRLEVIKHLENNDVAHTTAYNRCKKFIEKNLIPYDEATDSFYIESTPSDEPEGIWIDDVVEIDEETGEILEVDEEI